MVTIYFSLATFCMVDRERIPCALVDFSALKYRLPKPGRAMSTISVPQYIEPVFRPPSEARSLILQVTNGCSWNRCTFCEMYTLPQKKFRLKPFAEIGYGHDLANSLGFGVWSVGMRTIVTWPVRTWYLSFGTKFQYLSTFTSDIAFADDYGEIRLGFDARHPLPFTIGGNQADLSGYFIRRQYVDAFIERGTGEPLEVQYTNELGFTFGTTPKVKLWFIPLPRIGLGYRWGPNVTGIRLNFGFPF